MSSRLPLISFILIYYGGPHMSLPFTASNLGLLFGSPFHHCCHRGKQYYKTWHRVEQREPATQCQTLSRVTSWCHSGKTPRHKDDTATCSAQGRHAHTHTKHFSYSPFTNSGPTFRSFTLRSTTVRASFAILPYSPLRSATFQPFEAGSRVILAYVPLCGDYVPLRSGPLWPIPLY